jgi:acyl-ACP thioesterase
MAFPEEFTLEATVSYGNVDRDQRLSLRGLFQLLQEAAIKHADCFDSGTRAKATRGESWVLHRLAAEVHRYPRYEEAIRVVTWSSGIRAFKGYRDFRVYCGSDLAASASTVWLYVNLETKALSRVPREVAGRFPSRPEGVFCPELEKIALEPARMDGMGLDVTLRYSDIDGNGHVNNTTYWDCLQTALVRAEKPQRPSRLRVEFLREIAPEAEKVSVFLEPRGGETAFALAGPSGLCARGIVG